MEWVSLDGSEKLIMNLLKNNEWKYTIDCIDYMNPTLRVGVGDEIIHSPSHAIESLRYSGSLDEVLHNHLSSLLDWKERQINFYSFDTYTHLNSVLVFQYESSTLNLFLWSLKNVYSTAVPPLIFRFF